MKVLRKLLLSFIVLLMTSIWVAAQDNNEPPKDDGPVVVNKPGAPLDLRSEGKVIADQLAQFGNLVDAQNDSFDPLSIFDHDVRFIGNNVQVNDPKLDTIQLFPGLTRPFVQFTQSETTIAAHGQNEVVTYNNSNNEPIVRVGNFLFFTQLFLSGFSASHDGGKTWTSGSMPPLPGSIVTLGDGVVVADRRGNFFFSGLGESANFRVTVQVNKSTDGGRTFGPAVQVAQDNGGDKEWIAVGPTPRANGDDSDEADNDDRPENVYVTWTSFQPTGGQLRLGISSDGGATFTTKTIFAPTPDPNPANPQNFVSFSNPFVDSRTGFLYIPFLHESNSDADFIRILVSKDAGQTFQFISFNIPGAPDPTLLPVVQPGDLIDCGGGGFRLGVHSGPNIGPGQFGLDKFINVSRLIVQPAFAARGRELSLAWAASDSPFFSDPTAHSNILFIHSDDGGLTWSSPVQVNPAGVANDVQHFHPSLAVNEDGRVHITYYTQHVDEDIDLDLASSSGHQRRFRAQDTVRLTSTAFPLPPTNIPFPLVGRPFNTTNYDRGIAPCYSLGEYQGVTTQGADVLAAWGDARNKVTEPNDPLDPIAGQTHAQQDVFTQKVRVQDDEQ